MEEEIDGVVIESGTENEGLGAKQDETTIDHHDEIEIYLMIGEAAEVGAEVAETEMEDSEEGKAEEVEEETSVLRAQVLHPRRRNLRQI